ncbi:penicillin-binding transpeptidase domain-containing protein [Paenibacillus daejeonensis]|uniref:penicillin-binding transpeptidase domain-containing protein n=1 Tax=Paenibacillus daejeonensis TaxID=135193 RepID=UPI0003A0AB33|nr:penicillin-binding transpeptidase domain-containing protein [Paenibacillus daejeonensis]
MTRRIKLRALLVGGLITLLFVVLMGRVYFVQVVHGDHYLSLAKNIWSASKQINPVRGTITDRNGNILAMDAAAYTVAVNPEVINKLKLEDRIVDRLHELLGTKREQLQKDVTAKRENGDFLVNREVRNGGWKIDKDLADQVSEFRNELRKELDRDDVGIYLMDDQKRYYPRFSMASHLLGYIEKNEGKAVYGLEQYYDEMLRGTQGSLKYEKDGKRVQLVDGEVEYTPAHDGNNLTLTIDTEIQSYIEAAIKAASKEYNPKSITAIAADPNTMEILGLGSYPNYDPNEYWETTDQGDFYNHSVRQLFEPGSTFKIVTLAAAVEEGKFDPNATYMSGSIMVGNTRLRDHKREGWGQISYLDGLKHSSNVAFVKMGAEGLGAEKLNNYISAFGFGKPTGIDLPGEVAGQVNFNWNRPVEVATVTYGQGVLQVTPIQQLAAVAAVANGGNLMQPHLVKRIEDPTTGAVTVVEPKLERQVISEETSRKVGEYLEQVVSDEKIGTGHNAYIDGYRIAGKTGTAQKAAGPGQKGYSANKYLVSFIGYAPVEDPKIVVYVVVDEPQEIDGRSVGGGSVAAPIFREIVEKSLLHMGVAPTTVDAQVKEINGLQTKIVDVPDLEELQIPQAQTELQARGLNYELLGSGTTVIKQIPKAGSSVPSSQRIYLLTEERSQLTVPNMRGLSLRDALEVCSLLDMRCISEGEGYVTSQMQAKLDGEDVIKLVLQPPGEPEDDGETVVEGEEASEETTDTGEESTDTTDADNDESEEAPADER